MFTRKGMGVEEVRQGEKHKPRSVKTTAGSERPEKRPISSGQ